MLTWNWPLTMRAAQTDAVVTEAAGTVAVTGVMSVGGHASPAASAFDEAGGLLAANWLIVAAFSAGPLVESAGRVTSAYVKVGTCGSGVFRQTGGTSSLGGVYLGFYYGGGTLDLFGTAAAAVASLDAGQYGGPGGELDLAGHATVAQSGTEAPRTAGGTGKIVQSGGANAAGTLDVGGNGSGTGTYAPAGGTLSAHLAPGGLNFAAVGAGEAGSLTRTEETFPVGGSLFVGLGGAGAAAVSGGTLVLCEFIQPLENPDPTIPLECCQRSTISIRLPAHEMHRRHP